MSTRYRVTELVPSGYGRRFMTNTLWEARELIADVGGQWRFERQWFDGVKWRRDGGREPIWTEGMAREQSEPVE